MDSLKIVEENFDSNNNDNDYKAPIPRPIPTSQADFFQDAVHLPPNKPATLSHTNAAFRRISAPACLLSTQLEAFNKQTESVIKKIAPVSDLEEESSKPNLQAVLEWQRMNFVIQNHRLTNANQLLDVQSSQLFLKPILPQPFPSKSTITRVNVHFQASPVSLCNGYQR
jgi:hypothetical protein